jgi:uncharacterized RDD family membrane protein YckC
VGAERTTSDPDGGAIEPAPSLRYIGLASRALSFVIDAAIISVVAIMAEVGGALIISLLHLPKEVKTLILAIGGAAFILWTIAYFVAFWSGTGQTPGARVLQIRVVNAAGGRVKPSQAALRCLGVFLAALPLFLGFVPILYDSKRRGLQDRIARTLVVDAPQLSIAEMRQLKKRSAYRASRNSTSVPHD